MRYIKTFSLFESVDSCKCNNCGWSWKLESDDTNPYLCHKCGYDEKLQAFDMKALNNWKKENNLFETFLNEKKSVGMIYHFTEPKNLIKILKEDRMHSGHGHISFSRNFDLKSWYEDYGAVCRIAFNGSDMSNKFKLDPYLFDPANDILFGGGPAVSAEVRRKRYGQEMEERIVGEEIQGIVKYIVQVDILDTWREFESVDKKANTLNMPFPINVVKKITPVKGQIT